MLTKGANEGDSFFCFCCLFDFQNFQIILLEALLTISAVHDFVYAGGGKNYIILVSCCVDLPEWF